MTPNPLPDDTLARIKELLAKATPQNIDAAEVIGDDYIECPVCDGQGEVQRKMYTNYDGAALSVGFFGIGNAHLNAEALFRALVKHVPTLISRLEAAEARAVAAEAALDRYRYAIHWMAADAWDAEHSGGEARARCEWARGEDRGSNLDNNRIAIIGQTFLATTGRARAALTANPKDTG